jgi:hypothetical protein
MTRTAEESLAASLQRIGQPEQAAGARDTYGNQPKSFYSLSRELGRRAREI